MILEIKKYLQQHRAVPIKQLCQEFSATEDTIQHVLGHWLQKQCCQIITRQKCSNCTGCPLSCSKEQWVKWEDTINVV